MSWPTKKAYFEDAKYRTTLIHNKYQRTEKKNFFLINLIPLSGKKT